jgi:L-alanine-DL-glutamate epimerase-like enolase superfamily enzyme
MSDDQPAKDPIEGFQIIDYDQATETLTIAVDEALFKHAKSKEAMSQKAVDIIGGPSVSKVVFVPR